MNDFYTHLKAEAARTRLSSAEKRALRLRLAEILSAPPVRSPYQRFFAPHFAVAYSLLAILIVGSGTAAAAQGSLPGDVLYPIKIHVNESVETALAITPRAKVEVNATIAKRRVEEVQALAAQGTLDAEIAAQVEQNFDYYAAQVEKHAKDSPREDTRALVTEIADSLTEVADALAEADDSVETFSAATLPQATTNDDKDERTRKSSKDFADHVRARAWSMKHSGPDGANAAGAAATTTSGSATTTSDGSASSTPDNAASAAPREDRDTDDEGNRGDGSSKDADGNSESGDQKSGKDGGDDSRGGGGNDGDSRDGDDDR